MAFDHDVGDNKKPNVSDTKARSLVDVTSADVGAIQLLQITLY
jgi:hypothetical protein